MANKIQRECVKCGKETSHWDNRQDKRNPKAPDYKCCECGNGVWEKKSAPPWNQKPKPENTVANITALNGDLELLGLAVKLTLSDTDVMDKDEAVAVHFKNLKAILNNG